MSDAAHPGNEGPPGGPITQEFQHSAVGARVPEKVARGVFTTGAQILQANSEFVLDFVLRMNQPHQVVARVVMPFTLMPQLIEALRTNLEKYKQAFGPLPALPQMPPQAVRPATPTIEEVYQSLKLHDDMLAGVYATKVLVMHTPSDFCFDFITDFYPRAVVSARVFFSAAQVPVFLNTLAQSWQKLQEKLQRGQGNPGVPPA